MTITMKIYDAADYPGTDDKTVISKVVEFEPSGIIFSKPVLISMISQGSGDDQLKAVKKKVVTAAVYREAKGEWSYSPVGAAVKIAGRDELGDPIMQSVLGEPIMLSAARQPIRFCSSGCLKREVRATGTVFISGVRSKLSYMQWNTVR